MGSKNNNLKVNCIALAVMALFAETMEEAQEQILQLKEQVGKIGLHISIEKTKIMKNIKHSRVYLKVQELND